MAALVDNGTDELGDAECRQMLSQASVGRVGFTLDSLPAIIPVRCALLDDDVVFRSADGARVRAALHDAVIAFEVDVVDDDGATWSIQAVGRAREVDGAEERERIRERGLGQDGPDGERDEFVRLHPQLLTGRRTALSA